MSTFRQLNFTFFARCFFFIDFCLKSTYYYLEPKKNSFFCHRFVHKERVPSTKIVCIVYFGLGTVREECEKIVFVYTSMGWKLWRYIILEMATFLLFFRLTKIDCLPNKWVFFFSVRPFVQICAVLQYCYADIQYTSHKTDDHIHINNFFLRNPLE